MGGGHFEGSWCIEGWEWKEDILEVVSAFADVWEKK
jgi:hypothetical protein